MLTATRAVVEPGAYLMYGAECSMFSAKLRCYLRWKGIPFGELPASRKVYQEVILPRTGVGFIPVLKTPEGWVWQDTAEIIDRLEARFSQRPLHPTTPRRRLAAELLSLFGDEWLVLPAMHYRWSFPRENRAFIERAFGAVAMPGWPRPLQRLVGRRVARRFAGMLTPLGINADTAPPLEAATESLLDDFEAHLQREDFLLGPRASIADFSWAGAFVGHLAHDPYPSRWLDENYPAVLDWVERMRHPGDLIADWPEGDELPPTTLVLLQRFGRQQFPVLSRAAERLDQWADDRPPGTEVPRSLGRHEVRLHGQSVERAVLTHPLWRWQQVRDQWCALEGQQRAAADRLLAGMGVLEGWLRPPRTRLERRDNRLYLAGDGSPIG